MRFNFHSTINDMIIRFAEDSEITDWDQRVITNPDGGNFLQGRVFAELKQATGWKPRYLLIDTLAIMVLEKRVFGLGRIWYIPKGPGIRSVEQLAPLIEPLKHFVTNGQVFAIKIEPELLRTDKNLQALRLLKLQPVLPIQPNFSTVVVDISRDMGTILTELPQTGRYSINRAVKDGVTVQQVRASNTNCKIMYDLLALTAESAQFGIRSYEYYEEYWRRFETAGQGQLFFAMHGGNVVAGVYAIVFGAKSFYKDGASIREREAYGASHLLQWRVMEWAKARGSNIHDLYAVPPFSQIDNKAHKFYGIGLFKRSFNPHVTDYVGCYEITVRPFAHRIWRMVGERLARRLHTRRHRENYY